ncbi:hypothetical protein F4054_00085 [Candidatus Poribacteria bacterium]|nr:hypothetical protein [Candidatus Poribacteria bacterium]MYG07525.1 hypothetical protein [Candidatus Poribacteria bacterium]MYK20644.1 hypothetical protein [Candidatus Poribacteria bacterium]
MSTKSQNHGAEYKIAVKSGNLAGTGKGTMQIMPTTDGQFSVNVLLPDEKGVLKPLDLTTVERVELVQRKIGWFGKNQWTKPLVITAGNFIGVPFLLEALVGVQAAGTAALLAGLTLLGTTYGAGVYTGTRLTRLARFVLTTEDEKHAVLEASENVFYFLDGVYTAPNIQLESVASETSEEPAVDEVPEAPATAPAPATA